MALWRIIAEDMLDYKPYLLCAEKDAALLVMDELELVVQVCSFCEDLPNITGICQCLV
jgi:hypothetical protein